MTADASQGLLHVERIVGLLRGRRHPVAGLSAELSDGVATIAVWGDGLHDGDDSLVLRRLRRLPGVYSAHVQPTEPPG